MGEAPGTLGGQPGLRLLLEPRQTAVLARAVAHAAKTTGAELVFSAVARAQSDYEKREAERIEAKVTGRVVRLEAKLVLRALQRSAGHGTDLGALCVTAGHSDWRAPGPDAYGVDLARL